MDKNPCTTKDDDYPIIYRVLYIPGGAGFQPSTVVAESWIHGENPKGPVLSLARETSKIFSWLSEPKVALKVGYFSVGIF